MYVICVGFLDDPFPQNHIRKNKYLKWESSTEKGKVQYLQIGYTWFLGGGFKYLLCSPLFGETIQFDYRIFLKWGLKPPPSDVYLCE